MDKETEREIQKLRTEVNLLRDRVKLMLSARGGYVNGMIRQDGDHYLEAGHDVYPDEDDYGLSTRVFNHSANTIDEHWRNGVDTLTWTGWASYTGFGTPTSLLARRQSNLVVAHTSALKMFYYRTITPTSFVRASTRVTLNHNAGGGLMLDDGTDTGDGDGADNFVRVFLYNSGGNTVDRLRTQYRVGGGSVTTTDYFTGLLEPARYRTIQIATGGTEFTSWLIYFYFQGEGVDVLGTSRYIATINPPFTWTPARIGVYGETTGSVSQRLAWDWYEEGVT